MPNKYVFEKGAGENAFWLSDGRKIDTIKQLYNMVDKIDDAVFGHHVNHSRNDFSAWIKAVFHEEELAEKISKLSDKKKIKSVMGDWIYGIVHDKHNQKKEVSKDVIKTEKKESIFKNLIKENEGFCGKEKLLSGIIDFILGFMIGAVSMLIFLNMV